MSEEDVLLKIYIGQNISDEGILQSEIREKEEIKIFSHLLLSQLKSREDNVI